MKEPTKNILGYGAILAAGLLLGSAIVGGTFPRHVEYDTSLFSNSTQNGINKSLYRHAGKLQSSGNARDLAASAFFLDSYQPTRQVDSPASVENIEQLRQAIASSPNDADLAWLEATDCARLFKACDKQNAIRRLNRIEPDNLAVHLLEFNQASINHDDDVRDMALNAMANSRYSDIHYFSLGGLYYDALRNWNSPVTLKASEFFQDDTDQTPVTIEEQRKMIAIGYSAASAIPALQFVSDFCKKTDLNQEQLQNCKSVARLMTTDKTIVVHRIGLRIGIAVFKHSPEAEQWRAAYLQSHWLSSQYAVPSKHHSGRDSFKAWPNIDEFSTMKQKLAAEGIPLSPPADWMPDSEEIRKLLVVPIVSNP